MTMRVWTGYLWLRAAVAVPLGLLALTFATASAVGGSWKYALLFVALGALLICLAPILLVTGGSAPDAPVLARHRRGAWLWRVAVSRWWFAVGIAVGISCAVGELVARQPTMALLCVGCAGGLFVLLAVRASDWGEPLFPRP